MMAEIQHHVELWVIHGGGLAPSKFLSIDLVQINIKILHCRPIYTNSECQLHVSYDTLESSGYSASMV